MIGEPPRRMLPMPAVVCPFCRTPAALPDPWPHAGYTCPSCRAAVSFGGPPPPPPAADPLDFDTDDRPRRVDYRNKTRMGDAAVTGFGDGFGRELGRLAAGCAVMVVVLSVVVILFALALSGRN
jgi:hypothetical protein